MKLLLDTNIFLEIILEQQQSAAAKALLSDTKRHEYSISIFSLHSIGVVLCRRNKHVAFERLIEDLVPSRRIQVVKLLSLDLRDAASISRETGLDFDDAYQTAVARKWGLEIVRFERDFDRSGLRRWTPDDLVGK